MTDTNSDLVTADPSEAPAAPEVTDISDPAAHESQSPVDSVASDQHVDFDVLHVQASDVLSPAEFTHTEVIEPVVHSEDGPIDQHAESGYRPVGGAEVQSYLRAKSMGLEGRPSKAEVEEFLTAKGVRE